MGFIITLRLYSLVLSFTYYNDVIMGAIASQVISLTIVHSTVYSDADQRKHQSSTPLASVRRNHRGPVNSPHKWSITRKMFLFDDVIMTFPFLPVVGSVCLIRNIYTVSHFHQYTLSAPLMIWSLK